MADAEAARAAAEARRQKILARGRDRLAQITVGGAAGEHQLQSSTSDVSKHGLQDAATPGSSRTTLEPHGGATAQPSDEQQRILLTQQAAASSAVPPPADAGAQPVTSIRSAAGEQHPTRKAVASLELPEEPRTSSPLPDVAQALLVEPTPASSSATAASQAPGSVSQRLRCAIRVTQLPRVLLALVLAQLLFSETVVAAQLRVPPLLLLTLLQVSIIYATLQLLRISAVASLLGDIKSDSIPASIRLGMGPDLTGLLAAAVPGLREAASLLGAVSEAMRTVTDSLAVFLVTYVMLNLAAKQNVAFS